MAFTEEENHLITELREKVADLLEDDFERSGTYLVTWIKYRNNDLKKAEQTLRASKKWRTDFGISEIVYTDMKDLQESLPTERSGFDNDGCPIIGINFDKDVRKLVNVPDGRERFVKFMMANCEATAVSVRKQYAKTDGSVSTFVCIVDMGGFVFGQIASPKVVSTLIELVKYIEDNYPGVLKTLFIINTPRMFKIVFDIFKPFMSAQTLSRIRLYDSNRAPWRKALLENIPQDQLPSFAKTDK